MTDKIFFDNDCICAFLWVKQQCILEKMYPGKIYIPKEVYNEIDNPSTPHLKERVDQLIISGSAFVFSMDISSEEYALYRSLTSNRDGKKMIGKGEAASISLAKKYEGILASNNLTDIQVYIDEYSLEHITTGDILVEAYKKGYITVEEGNDIWKSMLKKRRKIGADSFTEYLQGIEESF